MSDWDIRVNTHQSLQGTAVLSDCGRYRFRLTRQIGDEAKACCFIMLNPSTADYAENDPTIRRCMSYAKEWECGELHVVNLFGYRASNPEELKDLIRKDRTFDIEGAQHNRHFIAHSIIHAVTSKGPVVCAWGTEGRLQNADLSVLKKVRSWTQPTALKITKDGNPGHPLYLSKTLVPIPYAGRAA